MFRSKLSMSGGSQAARQRPEDHGEDTPAPKAKRAKYAAAACDQCRKRKAKCVRERGSLSCQRCLSFGQECLFTHASEAHADTYNEHRFERLEDQVAALLQRLDAVQRDARTSPHAHSPVAAEAGAANGRSIRSRPQRQPRFVGRTRSAFSFDVAKDSLRGMGIADGSGATSGNASPEPGSPEASTDANFLRHPLLQLSQEEILRLIRMFDDEVHPVYPFVDASELVNRIEAQSKAPQGESTFNAGMHIHSFLQWDEDDRALLTIVVAIGNLMKSLGPNVLSAQLVSSVEKDVLGGYMSSSATYAKIAVMALLSLYYFHADHELLAWRTIGSAARMALELGYHRAETLAKTYPEEKNRKRVTSLFWCIYVLDRRWSFGTSLPFALQDSDIDPELQEPDGEAEYLHCMVKYGRLCSKVWQIFPNFGSPTQNLDEEKLSYIEFQIHNWLNSIPSDLRLGDTRQSQDNSEDGDSIKQRLRALLYLRGNHLRILIRRHHVLSTSNIHANVQAAQRVVDIAKDSIHALVQLNKRGDVYVRQQVAFNYFLASGIAAIFLAACHEPLLFGKQCKTSFFDAVELIRQFSSRSSASKRLWKSIRKMLPGARKVLNEGFPESGPHLPTRHGQGPSQAAFGGLGNRNLLDNRHGATQDGAYAQVDARSAPLLDVASDANFWNNTGQQTELEVVSSESMPDLDQITSDLSTWYETFGLMDGNGNGGLSEFTSNNNAEFQLAGQFDTEQLFQELLCG